MADLQTLPNVATAIGASLDSLRSLVRRSPELRRLGRVVGGLRVLSAHEAELITDAWRARRAARERRAVPGA